jgi:hypothetical protein
MAGGVGIEFPEDLVAVGLGLGEKVFNLPDS